MSSYDELVKRAIAARADSGYGVGAAYVTDCTPEELKGSTRRLEFLVAHDRGVDHVLGELHADDLDAYACPDYRLAAVTPDELAGALEARAAGQPIAERGAWVLGAALSREPVRLFPQDLGSRAQRLRLRGTVFDVAA
jgi:hypothetical protein